MTAGTSGTRGKVLVAASDNDQHVKRYLAAGRGGQSAAAGERTRSEPVERRPEQGNPRAKRQR